MLTHIVPRSFHHFQEQTTVMPLKFVDEVLLSLRHSNEKAIEPK